MSKRFNPAGLIASAIIVLAVAGFSYVTNNTMVAKDTYEGNGFTFDLPTGFVENSDTSGDKGYNSEDGNTYVEYVYMDNDLDLSVQNFGIIQNEYMFTEEELKNYTAIDINGTPAYQSEYKVFAESVQEGVKFYYTGYMTYIKMDGGVIVFDTYDAIDESAGPDKEASDNKLALLQDIVLSINVTDTSAYIVKNTPGTISDSVLIEEKLSSDWEIEAAVFEDNIQFQTSYNPNVSANLYTSFDVSEDVISMEDLELIMDSYVEDGYIDSYQKTTIYGQDGYIYSYSTVSDSEYYTGVTAISQNCENDIFYYTFAEDFTLSDEEIDALAEIVSDKKMPKNK